LLSPTPARRARAASAWALAGALVAALPCAAESLSGVVVGVADGDTLTVLDLRLQQHRVRLAGIDAPEKRQPFGQRSRQSLSLLVAGRPVRVEGGKTDRYGRLVGKVLAGGLDVNREQVRRGFAWHYLAYAREQSPADRQLYADAENSARQERRGLWALPDATPPWEYRRKARGAVAQAARPQ
jgi:endonuclease YncB( thermonuclease family)